MQQSENAIKRLKRRGEEKKGGRKRKRKRKKKKEKERRKRKKGGKNNFLSQYVGPRLLCGVPTGPYRAQ